MMKNADMPINPIINDGENYLLFLDEVKGGNNYGLKKREYFAGLAMQIIDAPEDYVGDQHTKESYLKWRKKVVKMADELLKELDK